MLEILQILCIPEISQKSDEFQKTDSKTIEFRVQVPANAEKKVSYMVHYGW